MVVSLARFCHVFVSKPICFDENQQRGYGVASYACAQDALNSLQEQQAADDGGPYSGPDLIITDVNMPRMDGFQFLEALRAGSGRERAIPVVFLTARGMTQDRIEARELVFNRKSMKKLLLSL